MAPPTQSDPRWPRPLKVAASLALVIYLAAVIAPPLALPPASALAGVVLEPLRPLVHAIGLDHGYRFFAPNPGPGHSIRWTVTRSDGTTASGSIPDRDTDWPRLLYHRRFMVAEKIASRVPPVYEPAEVQREARTDWEPLVRGVARNLLRETGGAAVRLELVEHDLPGPDQVIDAEGNPDVITPLGTFGTGPGAGP